ncbi:hypothetical protein [Burkholderia pyrrocinia]|uniref:hypothetical protein n=1 Tax=Burkholderia pyrrocinia TaxID=60550 RepID=UPI001374F7AE|nr:hypothetical protein [Burkholderia pyrrocinia]
MLRGHAAGAAAGPQHHVVPFVIPDEIRDALRSLAVIVDAHPRNAYQLVKLVLSQ